MSRMIQVAVAILLLLLISFAFVSPLMSVEPTALRAMRAATLLFAVLAALATALTTFLPPACEPQAQHPLTAVSARSSILTLDCVLRC
jgi:hypothetical protein